jgi:hypothetical protein
VLRKQNIDENIEQQVFIKTRWFLIATATLNKEKEKKLYIKTIMWFSFNSQ